MIKLTPYQKKVFEALKEISQNDNHFGNEEIRITAAYLMIKPISIRACIKSLIDSGVIKRVGRNVYQIFETDDETLSFSEKAVRTEEKENEYEGLLKILKTIELQPRYHEKMQIRISRLSRPLRMDEIDNHRAEHCFYGEFCTDYAIKNQFISFSCSQCPIFLSKRKNKMEVPG